MTTTVRANRRTTPDLIAARKPFRGSNTAGVDATGRTVDTGHLPREWVQRLRSKPVTYVVFSYATPIAWVHEDGEVVIPDVKYSVSTSQHQGAARYGFRFEYGQTSSRS
jgi:hypothetical protein